MVMQIQLLLTTHTIMAMKRQVLSLSLNLFDFLKEAYQYSWVKGYFINKLIIFITAISAASAIIFFVQPIYLRPELGMSKVSFQDLNIFRIWFYFCCFWMRENMYSPYQPVYNIKTLTASLICIQCLKGMLYNTMLTS